MKWVNVLVVIRCVHYRMRTDGLRWQAQHWPIIEFPGNF